MGACCSVASDSFKDAVLTHVYKVEIPPEVSAVVAECEKIEAELNKIKMTLLHYSTDKTTIKLPLEKYNARLLARQDNSPTVSTVKLGDVAKRCKAVPLYAGEYLLIIDGDVMKKLTFALECCASFKEHKTKVRNAQKMCNDEQVKQKQLQHKVDKAESKGEDATQFKGQLTDSKAGLAELEKVEAAAIKTCAEGLISLKADVHEALNYAVKRLRTSIAAMARKTTKARAL